ncbi:MAG: CapA family protein [Desulfobacterota bacterium]|nr:CapA family protein [Thermodesulfobacteriota bacterium]
MRSGTSRVSPRALCMLAFLLAAYPPELQADDPSREVPVCSQRLLAVGDIMLSGSARPVFRVKGYAYAFQDRALARLTSRADVAFGNLEYPITRSGSPIKDKKYTFRGSLESLKAVKGAGFDMLSLANNHIMDYGVKGLMDTLMQCRKNRLVHAGAGTDLTTASRPGIVVRNGVRYGLLAYSMTFPEDFWATKDRPGTAHPDITRMDLDIRAVRPAVDILIVSFHWGEELMREPKQYQVGFARYAIRSGADVVVGHHPHVPQAIEIYRGRPIFYSLGNYAFGSISSASTVSIAAETIFQRYNPVQVNIYPLNVSNKEVGFQPRLAKGNTAEKIIAHLREISLPFGTPISFRKGIGTITIAPEDDRATPADRPAGS